MLNLPLPTSSFFKSSGIYLHIIPVPRHGTACYHGTLISDRWWVAFSCQRTRPRAAVSPFSCRDYGDATGRGEYLYQFPELPPSPAVTATTRQITLFKLAAITGPWKPARMKNYQGYFLICAQLNCAGHRFCTLAGKQDGNSQNRRKILALFFFNVVILASPFLIHKTLTLPNHISDIYSQTSQHKRIQVCTGNEAPPY